jgi:hypothetical protein
MDTAILRKHLAKAERHVADAEQRVARQRALLGGVMLELGPPL